MHLKTDHLKRCIETLEASLSLLKQSDPDRIEYEVFRNAVIKGFELTLEISGKLLRKVLKPYFPTSKEIYALTFKDLFRHAALHGFLSVEEAERWAEYRDNRNNTAHDYGESFAQETLTLISSFIDDVKKLEERLSSAGA